jgi:hypothetical protein
MSDKQGLDIFGIQPTAEAVNKVTSAAVDGAGAFLSRICLPAAVRIRVSAARQSAKLAIPKHCADRYQG